ncbi:PDR/VanB family oxidoreductase [bacterium]|nr:PDR/VanB family oxidoreductase [bacterium]
MLDLKLIEVRDETERVRVIRFSSASGDTLPGYSAGAHLEFDLGSPGKRAYSLIDWPCQSLAEGARENYTVAVQREDDGQGGSSAMHQLDVGQVIQASEPVNDFALSKSSAPVVLLAGGIGVTPMISMATELHAQARPFVFHYTARSQSVMSFHHELDSAFSKDMRFHFDDESPLDLAALMGSLDASTELYLCGPRGMIDAARSAAQTAGLSNDNIHVELFSTTDTAGEDMPFEVEIKETGEVFVIPAGKTIIEVLEDAGKDLMYDCQRGDCGICQTDVISGEPDHRDVVLSEAERASGEVMQICVSRAKSSRLVLDIL